MKTCGGRIYDKERHDEGKATARILSGVGFVKAGLYDGCAPIQSRRGGGGAEWGGDACVALAGVACSPVPTRSRQLPSGADSSPIPTLASYEGRPAHDRPTRCLRSPCYPTFLLQ